MKLNKHISILLSALVLFANMGLVLNVHYCHDRVTSVAFAYKAMQPVNSHHHNHDEAEKSKGCCKADTHKKCCKDNVLKLKDSDEKTIVKSLQLDLGAFYVSDAWKPTGFKAFKMAAVKKDIPSFYCESNAPPFYKLYCQFVLYA